MGGHRHSLGSDPITGGIGLADGEVVGVQANVDGAQFPVGYDSGLDEVYGDKDSPAPPVPFELVDEESFLLRLESSEDILVPMGEFHPSDVQALAVYICQAIGQSHSKAERSIVLNAGNAELAARLFIPATHEGDPIAACGLPVCDPFLVGLIAVALQVILFPPELLVLQRRLSNRDSEHLSKASCSRIWQLRSLTFS